MWDELEAEGYRVEGELGRGALGVVLRAVELELGRPVAIKLLQAHAPSLTQLERFRREATIAANVVHPGLVRVHRVGHAGGKPYLVSELVPQARPLDQAWRTLTAPDRARLLGQVAEAVGAAHAEGVVHRDLKPDNVLVDGDGRARVTDFGLAYLESTSRLTQTGHWVGTPSYMAPEQFSGREPTPATDVWALGAMLYQALTDSLPFEGESLQALASAVQAAQPLPPRQVVPEVSLALERVCLRCLSAAPADRYPHASALAEALRDARRGVAPGATRRAGLVVGALLVALGGGGAWALLERRASAPPSTVAPLAAPVFNVEEAARRLAASDPQGALQALTQAPLEGEVPHLRLQALLRLGRHDEALELGRELNRPSDGARRLRGLAAVLGGELATAEQDLFGADRRLLLLRQDADPLQADMQAAYAGGILLDPDLEGEALRQRVGRVLDTAEQIREDWGPEARSLLAQAQDVASMALAVHVVARSRDGIKAVRALARRAVDLVVDGPSSERARLTLAFSHLLGGFNELMAVVERGLVRAHPDAWSEPVVPELRYFAYGLWFLGDPWSRLDAPAKAMPHMVSSQMRYLEEASVMRQAMYRLWVRSLLESACAAFRDGDGQRGAALAAEGSARGQEAILGWMPNHVASDEHYWRAACLLTAGDLEAADAAVATAGYENHRRLIKVEIALIQGRLSDAAAMARRAVQRDRSSAHAWATHAHTLAALGRSEESRQALGKALECAPDSTDPTPSYNTFPWRRPRETQRILDEGAWWPGR